MLDKVWYSGNFGVYDERFEKGKKSKLFYHPESFKRFIEKLHQFTKK